MNIRPVILTLPLLLAACSEIPRSAYYNRGGPESLIDASLEAVTVPLGDAASIGEFSSALNQDRPTSVALGCNPRASQCAEAATLLRQARVPFKFDGTGSGNAVFSYQRIVTRDCEQSYIDNSINPYNFNHPTFGCSIAANSLQMISDKNQIVSPATMDYSDAPKAIQVYNLYQTPPKGATGTGTLLTTTSR